MCRRLIPATVSAKGVILGSMLMVMQYSHRSGEEGDSAPAPEKTAAGLEAGRGVGLQHAQGLAQVEQRRLELAQNGSEHFEQVATTCGVAVGALQLGQQRGRQHGRAGGGCQTASLTPAALEITDSPQRTGATRAAAGLAAAVAAASRRPDGSAASHAVTLSSAPSSVLPAGGDARRAGFDSTGAACAARVQTRALAACGRPELDPQRLVPEPGRYS